MRGSRSGWWRPPETAIVGVDDNWSQAIADRVAGLGRKVVRISARRPLAHGFYAAGEAVVAAEDGSATEIARLAGVTTLRGAHNAQNAVAAAAAVRALGLDDGDIRSGLATFPGLRHRMEEVLRLGSVLFVNDSKATNVDAAAMALASFQRIYWIAGGQEIKGDISLLADFFPRIARAYLIGEAAESMVAGLADRLPYVISGDALGRGRCCRLGRSRRFGCAGGGAPVSGLRLVRSVQEFRRARGQVSRPCAGIVGTQGEGASLMVSRTDRSAFAEWWWTVDKVLLGSFVVLMLGGVVLSLAGSPAVAERLGYDSFHFFWRHLLFSAPALAVLIAASFLSARFVRRVALVVLGIALVLMVATLFIGYEINGARRWISVGELSIQPSEFMKPAFVVVVAWLFTENARRKDIPGNLFALILLAIVAALLIAEPDFGQTMLIVIAWGGLFFLAGVPWLWIVVLGAAAIAGVVAAYATLPHVAARIDRFVSPQSGDTYQVDRALESVIGGGWLGQGPGEGVVKRVLPDAHTDFIFAVAAEEFGIVMSIVLVLVFALVVLRGLSISARQTDPFVRLASSGLVILFGIQSAINLAVNLNLLPAKGMTLPFISYGGSSMVAIAFGMGLLLALTRRRPEPRQVMRRVDGSQIAIAGHA